MSSAPPGPGQNAANGSASSAAPAAAQVGADQSTDAPATVTVTPSALQGMMEQMMQRHYQMMQQQQQQQFGAPLSMQTPMQPPSHLAPQAPPPLPQPGQAATGQMYPPMPQFGGPAVAPMPPAAFVQQQQQLNASRSGYASYVHPNLQHAAPGGGFGNGGGGGQPPSTGRGGGRRNLMASIILHKEGDASWTYTKRKRSTAMFPAELNVSIDLHPHCPLSQVFLKQEIATRIHPYFVQNGLLQVQHDETWTVERLASAIRLWLHNCQTVYQQPEVPAPGGGQFKVCYEIRMTQEERLAFLSAPVALRMALGYEEPNMQPAGVATHIHSYGLGVMPPPPPQMQLQHQHQDQQQQQQQPPPPPSQSLRPQPQLPQQQQPYLHQLPTAFGQPAKRGRDGQPVGPTVVQAVAMPKPTAIGAAVMSVRSAMAAAGAAAAAAAPLPQLQEAAGPAAAPMAALGMGLTQPNLNPPAWSSAAGVPAPPPPPPAASEGGGVAGAAGGSGGSGGSGVAAPPPPAPSWTEWAGVGVHFNTYDDQQFGSTFLHEFKAWRITSVDANGVYAQRNLKAEGAGSFDTGTMDTIHEDADGFQVDDNNNAVTSFFTSDAMASARQQHL